MQLRKTEPLLKPAPSSLIPQNKLLWLRPPALAQPTVQRRQTAPRLPIPAALVKAAITSANATPALQTAPPTYNGSFPTLQLTLV